MLSSQPQFLVTLIPHDVKRFWPMLTWLHHIISADLSAAHSCCRSGVLPHPKGVQLNSHLLTEEHWIHYPTSGSRLLLYDNQSLERGKLWPLRRMWSATIKKYSSPSIWHQQSYHGQNHLDHIFSPFVCLMNINWSSWPVSAGFNALHRCHTMHHAWISRRVVEPDRVLFTRMRLHIQAHAL